MDATQRQVAKAVSAVVARVDSSKDDPYRTTIHFVVGLLTFCLGVLAAVFSALNSGDANPDQLGYKMLGGVLGSIALVAWLATAAAAFLQVLKFCHRYNCRSAKTWWSVTWRVGLMLVLVTLGGLVVAYCVRYGYAILTGIDTPVGLLESLIGLFLHAL